jgi:FAD:protein FMN transferase
VTTVEFAAMGTQGHMQIIGPHTKRLAAVGLSLVETLERRWSRFLPDSDVSRINRCAGREVVVDPSTLNLLAFAIAAWKGTNGRFSPFLGRAMHDIGYSRSWSAGAILTPTNKASFVATRFQPNDPMTQAPIHLRYEASTVSIEPDVQIDLGGLAKGYAADLVLGALLSSGATSALVDLGGDMSFSSGKSPEPRPWSISIDDPHTPGRMLDTVVANEGGVATSSTLRRRWNTSTKPAGDTFHHLIDPATGTSCSSDIASITVVADSCMNAEVLAKQLLILGHREAVCEATRIGVDVLMVGHDRGVTRVGFWEKSPA